MSKERQVAEILLQGLHVLRGNANYLYTVCPVCQARSWWPSDYDFSGCDIYCTECRKYFKILSVAPRHKTHKLKEAR